MSDRFEINWALCRLRLCISDCDDGWTLFDGHCYTVISFNRGTFEYGRRICSRYDSDLVIITSMDESNAINHYLLGNNQTFGKDLLIGMYPSQNTFIFLLS